VNNQQSTQTASKTRERSELHGRKRANYSGPPRPFRTGTPAFDAFPHKLWGRLLAQRWSNSAAEMLQYSDSAGYLPLRKAIAEYISTTRGVRCVPEQLIITSGSQHALEIVIRTVLKTGDKVWIEDPGFLGARASFIAANARLVPCLLITMV
jgi:GntR family transcriptional regulator/MocR family aminotransferase